jgi:acyl carrier protein
MTRTTTTLEGVRLIIAKELHVEPDQVALDADLRGETLKADSLDLVNLVMAFAMEFGVEMNDNELQNVVSVGDVVNYLERYLNPGRESLFPPFQTL